ncbi:MAG: class I tRNA ligase family protein [Pirellulales bacterium]
MRLESYRYADAARTLYDFAWNEFCSFYVEMTKARFAVPEQRATAQRVLAHALDVLMRLLHPMMPFLTEEVWQLLGQVAQSRGLEGGRGKAEGEGGKRRKAFVSRRGRRQMSHQDATIEEQFADFQAVLGAARRGSGRIFRSRRNSASPCGATKRPALFEPMQPYFSQMAHAGATAFGPKVEPQGVTVSFPLSGRHGPLEVHVDVSRFIDVVAERSGWRRNARISQSKSNRSRAS